ncbi:Deoxyribodipyrimidine photolyase/cryptochrome [Emiliania huxleyi CCMP1516]|uniref:Cryptochrome/DNA photolyase FAD-binding domain-containing protein n=2 Tax=Emiliania huxleyi TaxID=2903 RepID=A0A0D3IXS4_EMIH1|nr:Deoxyribodipyrimidine photolyase/cryptochrome [Emiliania huxleyi CCMP1516]XP_005770975.1 Deoxyribodipyrimidine photolyase/cryptochrome [Emiliania huxleyi CCMP1516]EOD16059.1 Deoxyribodipyrimidine photolyase/cryptochrome [Emiliania huxleyi CCMP1516]EOD18546.1 Deoxyribodipyrimidine photolyase/cryptochrome [Emiliania huxleyi CCMP1516]|eukprot:XP_005768488.1 Deoxyribodipyrimidine photolyase/cryptochrome [Emiliania huxleyi CCMP1516]
MTVPDTLGAMGYTDAPPSDADESSRLRGGESAALARLDAAVCARAGWVCAFSKPDTNPLPYSPGSTTMLSPYLSLGCLSCRTMHAALDAIVRQAEGQHTTPPQSLHGQLYFREFFHLLSASSPHFGQTRDNPLCLTVEWRDPARDANAAEALRRWEGGTTGVPLIDAAMVQLKEAGRNVFDRHLLDADWAINSANWMWLSATSFYTYHRVYSTAHFARKYDRSGRYVRKWLPALRRMPDEYVYEPWKAPLTVQRAASCIVGVDYPLPICDPESAAAANLTRMDACYRKAPEEWKALIPPAAAAEVARERNVNADGATTVTEHGATCPCATCGI